MCYGLNLDALYRARYSQSKSGDYERGSQSGIAPEIPDEAADREPASPHCELRSPTPANVVRPQRERPSPDPSMNRQSEPSGKKSTDAAASAPAPSADDRERRDDGPTLKQLEALAHDEWVAGDFDQQVDSKTLLSDFSAAVRDRAARLSGFDYAAHVDRMNCAIFNVQMQRSRRSAYIGNGRRVVNGFTRVGAL